MKNPGHFSVEINTEVIAGKLDRQFLHVLDDLRSWEAGGVWMLAYAR